MYLSICRQDTFRGVAGKDTPRIISSMGTWTDRARARMRELNITQDKLISVLGVETRGAVGHYLTGRRDPSIDQVIRLANALEISLDSLLVGPQSIKPVTSSQTKCIHDLQAAVSRLSDSDARNLLPIVEKLAMAATPGTAPNDSQTGTDIGRLPDTRKAKPRAPLRLKKT